ncbi:MAG: minor capsid protein [Abditibacteriota bacterium]|nr:minor capsid protein [Abditibacteriota bacterium]
MGVSLAAALRLLRTESSHIAQEGAQKAYEEIGLEKYKILSTLDSVTCKRCGALDGVSIEVKERKPGVNSPPFHPNCRCTTVPDVDDLDLELDDEGNPIEEERVYRDENGKSVIGPEMSYDEWKKKYVGGDKTAKVDELLKAKAEAAKYIENANDDKAPSGKNKAPDGKKPKAPGGGKRFSNTPIAHFYSDKGGLTPELKAGKIKPSERPYSVPKTLISAVVILLKNGIRCFGIIGRVPTRYIRDFAGFIDSMVEKYPKLAKIHKQLPLSKLVLVSSETMKKRSKDKKTGMAVFCTNERGKPQGILLNSDWYLLKNAKKFIRTIAYFTKIGKATKGFAPESVLLHEYAHYLIRALFNDDELLVKAFLGKVKEACGISVLRLSEIANTNIFEEFSELFAKCFGSNEQGLQEIEFEKLLAEVINEFTDVRKY